MNDAVSDHTVFLVSDGSETSRTIGTCFFVHEDEEKWYFMTCQHVVDRLMGATQIMLVGDAKAELAHPGNAKSYDLAVLSVGKQSASITRTAEHLRQTVPLQLSEQLPEGSPLDVVGHRTPIATKVISRKLLTAELKGEDRIVEKGTVIPAFNLSVPDIAPGFSGSPVLLRGTRTVIGIAAIQEGVSGALALSPVALRFVSAELSAKLLPESSVTIPLRLDAGTPAAQTVQGFIVAGDIANFSSLSDNEQLAAWLKLVSVLDSILKEDPFVKAHSSYVRNLKADSFTIAFPAVAQAADQDNHADLIHFAEECIQRMEQQDEHTQPYPIRIALHQGGYQEVLLKTLDNKHVIGTAVNDCQRLLGVSDEAGYIVASDAFVSGWYTRNGRQVDKYFRPSRREPSVQVFLHRDRPQGVRMYVGGQRASKPVPEGIWLPRALSDHLHQQIENLADACLELLLDTAEEQQFQLSPAELALRASLFVPRPLEDEYCLCSTEYRHTVGLGKGHEGSTVYPLTESGVGPAGRAFVTNQIQVLHNLPDYREDPEAYLSEFRPWQVDEEAVRGFGRHSRAFIEIPFGIPRNKAMGVLCIDTVHPLSQFNVKQLREAAEILAYAYNYRLIFAALWRLRTQ